MGDTPVATLRPNGATVSIYYVHTDGLDTPRQVTRPADNVQMWTWFSDPFGTDAANPNPSGAGAFTENSRLPGQIFSGTAGLHENGFRDYDPAIGRYLESDPLGLAAGINTYSYVGANPIAHSDPLGLLDPNGWSGAAARAAAKGVATDASLGGPADPVGDAAAIGVTVGAFGFEAYLLCSKDSRCDKKAAEIEASKDVVVSRYFELQYDRKELFTKAYDKPNLGKRAGTYLGHIKAFVDAQINLRNHIAEAVAMGCPVSEEARKWAAVPAPTWPAKR